MVAGAAESSHPDLKEAETAHEEWGKSGDRSQSPPQVTDLRWNSSAPWGPSIQINEPTGTTLLTHTWKMARHPGLL